MFDPPKDLRIEVSAGWQARIVSRGIELTPQERLPHQWYALTLDGFDPRKLDHAPMLEVLDDQDGGQSIELLSFSIESTRARRVLHCPLNRASALLVFVEWKQIQGKSLRFLVKPMPVWLAAWEMMRLVSLQDRAMGTDPWRVYRKSIARYSRFGYGGFESRLLKEYEQLDRHLLPLHIRYLAWLDQRQSVESHSLSDRYAMLGLRFDEFKRGLNRPTAVSLAPQGQDVTVAEPLSLFSRRLTDFDPDATNESDQYPALTFKNPQCPTVSIVMPLHNKFHVTHHALVSLLAAFNQADFELVVVDDASSDQTLNIQSVVSGITVLRHDQSQGFVHSCNHGASVARGEYVLLLNNDVEVMPGWLDEIVSVFKNFDRVGLVGAKLLYPDGRLQEAGGMVWSDASPANYGRNGDPRDPRYNYVRQVDYLSGACIALPRSLWNDLGGFDPLFAPAYFEDTDLAFRVRQKGYKTVYTPFSRVIHFEGVSNGTELTSGTKLHQQLNAPKFKDRWASTCLANGLPNVQPDLNKDRNIRLRVLIIDAVTPSPDKDAGSYAAIQEMRILQALGCKLTFVPDNMAYVSGYTEGLQRMGVECVFAPYQFTVSDLIAKRGREFDLVYITRYYIAEKHVDSLRRLAPQAKIVFNNADLHFLREIRVALTACDKDLMQKASITRDAELAVMRKVDLVLSYSDTEQTVIMSHNLDASRLATCPWVVEIPATVPVMQARRDVAFLGGYGHPPNVDAVRHFVADIMPILRIRLPGVRFLVYGSNVPASFNELACADVIIKGQVPEVGEVYDTCRVFVANLRSGAGLKGKVVGAMAHGVPCVLSPIAAEGIGLSDGAEALIAQTPQEWVDAIVTLHEDPQRWEAVSDAARRFAKRKYSFDVGVAMMRNALMQIGIQTEKSDHSLRFIPVLPSTFPMQRANGRQ
jgi:GT2 family glycosyltransferase/glycosyltransferase involved in cell wall biosynthesis